MRKPNGYGSIKHLSGHRRRPFVFVVSKEGRQRPVAYFATQVEAEIFAADYNKIHCRHSLPGHQITLIELYHRWLPAHIADTGPSQSSLDSYKNAFRHLTDLHYEPVAKLRYADYQRILDGMKRHGLSYSLLKKVRSLISLLEKYALKTEIIEKSYAPLLSIGRNRPVRPHHTFSRQKINRLWAAVDRPGVDTVLILLYTGMRCGEMLQLQKADVHLRQRYIRITKSKTAAGIRIIPIHHRIAPLIESRMKSPGDALICDDMGQPYNYGRYCAVWRTVMYHIRADGHTTHDCRHTVATSQSGSTRTKACVSSVNASNYLNNLLLMRYYTSRTQTHKTRPLRGSIAVTIATHKNSKINVYLSFS